MKWIIIFKYSHSDPLSFTILLHFPRGSKHKAGMGLHHVLCIHVRAFRLVFLCDSWVCGWVALWFLCLLWGSFPSVDFFFQFPCDGFCFILAYLIVCFFCYCLLETRFFFPNGKQKWKGRCEKLEGAEGKQTVLYSR